MNTNPISNEEFQLMLLVGSPEEWRKAIHRTNKEQAVKLAEFLISQVTSGKVYDPEIPHQIVTLFKVRSQSIPQKIYQIYFKTFINEIFELKELKGIKKARLEILTDCPQFSIEDSSWILNKIKTNYSLIDADSLEFIFDVISTKGVITDSNFLTKIFPLFVPLIQTGKFKGTELHRYTRNDHLLNGLHKLASPFKVDTYLIDSAFKVFLKNLTTKSLLAQYKSENPYNRYDDDYSPQTIGSKMLKEELKTREHVPRPRDKKLISLMSKHAGKKLTLQEAQILNNKLNKR